MRGPFFKLYNQYFLSSFECFLDTLVSTVDTAKNVAASAVDKGVAMVGSAKGKAMI